MRARRLEMHLTQQDVARVLGVSCQQFQKYETGKNRISASRMFDLAKALSVEPAYFFETGAASKTAFVGKLGVAVGDDVRQLNAAFCRIKSKPVRRSVLDLIGTLASD